MNIAAEGKMAITLFGILKVCPQPLKEQGCSSELVGVTEVQASVDTHLKPVEQLNTKTGFFFFFFFFF